MKKPLRIRLNGLTVDEAKKMGVEKTIRSMARPPIPKDQPIEFYTEEGS